MDEMKKEVFIDAPREPSYPNRGTYTQQGKKRKRK